jgi:ABC-type Na+ efflux pump permease subunit
VLRIDDVPGVVAGDPHPQVLLQGNEAEWVQTVPGLVLDAAGAEIDVAFESLGAEASRLRRIAAALLAFCVLLMGGIAVGLLIIEERETAILRAYATSPLRFGKYVTAKFIGAAAMSLALGPICTAILLGADLPWVPLIVASLASLPAALLLGFIVATVAQDQVAAIAVLKSLLFFFTSLPLFGFFVTGPWALVLSPFSNHWAVQALYLALTPGHGIPWGPLALSLATGVPLVLLVVRVMRRKLGFVSA